MGRPRLSRPRRGHLTGLRIRPARVGDGPACRAVFQDAVHNGTIRAYSAEERAAWAPHSDVPARWEMRLLAGVTVVAERRGSVIGFMTLGTDGHLDLAYVAAEWAGRGVGGLLHEAVLEAAAARGLAHLSTEASLIARPFFARRGWREIARQSVIRNGVALTNFRMEREI